MEYYSAIKENEIMLFAATWMDLEIIKLSEVSQTEKRNIISFICGIFKGFKRNYLQNRKRVIGIETMLWY